MKDESKNNHRVKDVLCLTRALYESALHESDPERLELHRQVALKLKKLIDETADTDGTLHPDLGLELLLFIELKAGGNDEADSYGRYVYKLLVSSERRGRETS